MLLFSTQHFKKHPFHWNTFYSIMFSKMNILLSCSREAQLLLFVLIDHFILMYILKHYSTIMYKTRKKIFKNRHILSINQGGTQEFHIVHHILSFYLVNVYCFVDKPLIIVLCALSNLTFMVGNVTRHTFIFSVLKMVKHFRLSFQSTHRLNDRKHQSIFVNWLEKYSILFRNESKMHSATPTRMKDRPRTIQTKVTLFRLFLTLIFVLFLDTWNSFDELNKKESRKEAIFGSIQSAFRTFNKYITYFFCLLLRCYIYIKYF